MDHEWEERRHHELNLADGDPTVLIIGAGHTGLEIAARLKYMGVSTLVIDKHPRIGDNVRVLLSISTLLKPHPSQWRTRYKSLCLHDTICKSLSDLPIDVSYHIQGIMKCLTSGKFSHG